MTSSYLDIEFSASYFQISKDVQVYFHVFNGISTTNISIFNTRINGF